MADDTKAKTQDDNALVIPEETAVEFPELVGMIKQSHSMDDEERQYWVDVLPIMSDDQIENLRDILENEKKQIEEANKTYQKGMQETTDKVVSEFDAEAYKQKKAIRLKAENANEEEEKEREEALLNELENL
ncbi:hypothetical protein JW758_04435 [Candidatus Peregrinibacteria bacterium]|nr:hypothetical protein [Candidatus Peregrinibacteria bacterium]